MQRRNGTPRPPGAVRASGDRPALLSAAPREGAFTEHPLLKSSDTDAVEAAQHIRDRNERMIETSVRAGFSSLELCKKALKSIADLQEAVGDGSQLELSLRHCRGPGQVTRDMTDAYTSPARDFPT